MVKDVKKRINTTNYTDLIIKMILGILILLVLFIVTLVILKYAIENKIIFRLSRYV
jgi:hypothetical protein